MENQREIVEKVLAADTIEKSGSGSAVAMSPASYYFRFYLARAMESAGLGDLYVSSLKPWREMLRLGLTTWAEQPEPTRSDSHAWSAHPNFDLLRIVAGIRPGAPGFARVIIEPHMGSLNSFKAVFPHERGNVQVALQHIGKSVKATVILPPNLPAEFIWGGNIYQLHSGEQRLDLKEISVGD